LVLEAYIFHVALNSTFHSEALKDYNHLEALVAILTTSSIFRDTSTTAYRCSLWLGLPPDLFACIYKISYLRRQPLVTMVQWAHLTAINAKLERMASSQSARMVPQHNESSKTIICIHQLYIAAARLVLWKLMDPGLDANDPKIQILLHDAMKHLSDFKSESPLLCYPLAVLGTAAITEDHRELITSQLISSRQLAGHRSVGSVLAFLSTAWNAGHRRTSQDKKPAQRHQAQLDVWLDESLLASVGI
jgi:hypothetical protein